MSKTRINIQDSEIEFEYEEVIAIPEDWLDLIRHLNPITACVVWDVLTANLSEATIALAQSSPDWERYSAIRTVGDGDPQQLRKLSEQARSELDEIFIHVIPEDPRRIVH